MDALSESLFGMELNQDLLLAFAKRCKVLNYVFFLLDRQIPLQIPEDLAFSNDLFLVVMQVKRIQPEDQLYAQGQLTSKEHSQDTMFIVGNSTSPFTNMSFHGSFFVFLLFLRFQPAERSN